MISCTNSTSIPYFICGHSTPSSQLTTHEMRWATSPAGRGGELVLLIRLDTCCRRLDRLDRLDTCCRRGSRRLYRTPVRRATWSAWHIGQPPLSYRGPYCCCKVRIPLRLSSPDPQTAGSQLPVIPAAMLAALDCPMLRCTYIRKR